MGNDLIIGKKLFNQKTIIDNNKDLFQNTSNENKLVLKYKINFPGENIRLVGSNFMKIIKIIVSCVLIL